MNKPDMLEHAFNPSIPESGTADLSEFKAILSVKMVLWWRLSNRVDILTTTEL